MFAGKRRFRCIWPYWTLLLVLEQEKKGIHVHQNIGGRHGKMRLGHCHRELLIAVLQSCLRQSVSCRHLF